MLYTSDFNDWILPASVRSSLSAADKSDSTVHEWSDHWYGILSGYTPNRDYRKRHPSYGLQYNGDLYTKTGGSFVCASEPVGFGAYGDGKFYYTHYAINRCLTGEKNGTVFAARWRKTSCLKAASEAVIFMDSRLLDQYSAFALKSPAFRHGMKDPRAYQAYSSLTNASAGLCRGRSNFAFMDGHVQGAAYLEMTKWKPAYDITNYNLGFTDSRYDPFIRGFDPR